MPARGRPVGQRPGGRAPRGRPGRDAPGGRSGPGGPHALRGASPGKDPRTDPPEVTGTSPDEDPPGSTAEGAREDAELLRAHVAGDPRAFEEVVRRHGPRLWAVAAGVLRDGDEAADAVQDAFVSALRGAATFRGDAAVGTWLHRIVVNACLDRLRRARARPTVPLDAPAGGGGDHGVAERLPDAGDAHTGVETELVVRAALAELPVHQRAALVLVDLCDMPVAEAAAVLGVAVGTVKSRCARGRTAMAAVLRARGLDPRAGAGGGAVAARGNRAGPRDVRGDGGAQPPGPRSRTPSDDRSDDRTTHRPTDPEEVL